MRALLTLILGVLLSLTATLSWAAQDRRIALVIGNSAYRKFPQLPNPRNDAEDVSAALKRIGFTVLGGTDLTREAMRDSLRQFARAAQDAEAALVYYAGHGLQYRGRNYLVPVDAKLEDEFDLEYETMRVDDVVEELARAEGARIMILDACRNLPLAARAKDPFNATGLAKLSGRGLIVAYATQANQVAYDGTGRNSIFTGAFVKALQEPGLDAAQMFQRVSMNVDKQTGGRQTPELSLSYPGQFYFNKAETEREAWPRARISNDPQMLRDFIARFPTSFLVEDAKDLIQRLEERRAPQVAQASGPQGGAAQPDPERVLRQQLARRPEDDAPAGRSKEETERLAWQRLQEEQKRRAETRQQAEQERVAEEARQKKAAEERAVAEGRDRQRQAQEARLEEARQKKAAEDRAVADAKERQRQIQEAKAEEDRRRAEAQRQERDRVAEETRQKKLEQERAVADAKERQRQVQEAKAEEERRRADAQRQERERLAEENRQKKIADEAAVRERQRQIQEARADEERRQQEARRAELDRAAEAARQKKIADDAAAEARQRQIQEARAEEERRQQDARRSEQERVAEAARQKKIADDIAADQARQRQFQEARLEEDRRQAAALRAEQDRAAEATRQKAAADETAAAQARQRQVQEARLEEDRRQAAALRAEQDRVTEAARQKAAADETAAAQARQRQVQEAQLEDERRQAEAGRAEQSRQQALLQTDTPSPNTRFAYVAPQDDPNRLAWQQLEEQQKRRAQLQADRAATPDASASPAVVPVVAPAVDPSVQATLSAVRSRATSAAAPLEPGTADQPATMRLASNDAAQPVVTSVPPVSAFPQEALSRDKLVTETQAELGRIGCYADEPDGKWDRDARDALRRFGRQAKLSPVPSEPTAALLDDLKGRPEKFCPVECGRGQRVEGDACVAVARPEPAVQPKAKPRAVVQERRAPVERPVVERRPRPQAPPQAPVSTAASAPRQVPRAVLGVGF